MPTLDEIEARLTAALGGDWSREVDVARRALVSMWSANGGRLDPDTVVAILRRMNVQPAVVQAARELLPAAAIGDARIEEKTAVHLSTAATVAVEQARSKPLDAHAEAVRRAGLLPLDTMTGLLGVIAPLSRSVADIEAASSWAVQTAANEATVSAAAQTGASLVFVAERDACLRCNARSGDTGDALLADLPPVHPRCRCEVQPYADPEVVRALKREALRSVLRGWSLPSESQAARLRAAEHALGRRPNAPESVKRYAREAIKRGRFPRGRRPPNG